MSASGTESAGMDTTKQGGNRIQTGFEITQLSEFLDKVASKLDTSDREHVRLIRALAHLTAQSSTNTEGFINIEIAEQIGKQPHSPWTHLTGNDPDLTEIRNRVNKAWKNLKAAWPKLRPGIHQQFADAGYKYFPDISKTTGGGRSNTSKYQLIFIEAQESSSETILQGPPINWDGSILYNLEELTEAKSLNWLAEHGLALRGWRAKLFTGGLGLVMITLLGLVALMMLTLSQARTLHDLTSGALSLAILVTLAWVLIRPFYRLSVDRIILAPTWLQDWSAHEDRLIEIEPINEPRHNILRLKRYTAECPICGNKVRIKSGQREFHHRLVGRCERSPIEHVFSFDHVTRRGYFLRKILPHSQK